MRPVLPLVLLCSLAAAHEWNGLARDDAGNLFAIDAEDGQVWRIDVQGVVTLHLPGSRMEICNHPHHLAFDAQGALWIPGGWGTGLLHRVGPGGAIERIDWECPEGFELETVLPDGKGGLFLVSATAVLRRDAGGRLSPHAQAGSASGAVALHDDGSLLLGQTGRVVRVAPDGSTTVVAEGVGDVYGLAFDATGSLLVADWSGGRVLVVEGGAARVLASGLEFPSGLVPDAGSAVFVKESGRQTGKPMRITRVAPDGTASVFATIDRDAADVRLRTATFALG